MLLAMAVAGASAVSTAKPAIKTAIEMLNKMKVDSEARKNQESVQHNEYLAFAEGTLANTATQIEEHNNLIGEKDLCMQGETAAISAQSDEIEKQDKLIADMNGNINAATKVREINHKWYTKHHTDASETLDALEMAKQILEQEHFNTDANTLLQMFPAEARERAAALVQQAQNDDRLTHGNDRIHASALQPILDLIKQLRQEFTQQRRDVEAEEQQAVNAYEALMADMKQGLANAEERFADAQKAKADAQAKRSQCKETKSATETLLADVMEFSATLTAERDAKDKDFKVSQQLLEDELHAIATAIQVLSEQLTSPATGFAQLRASAPTRISRAVSYIQSEGVRQHSTLLSQLAEKALSTATDADPFKTVKEMIFKLISKLNQEANEEAQHKGWCDKEMGTNKNTRNAKERDVENTQADMDELSAKIAELTQFIAELSNDLSNLATQKAEAEELRKKSKDEHDVTIADAKQARQAINEAITILKNFYAKAGNATGQQEAGSGVISMLETIVTDCTRLESKTEQEEEAEDEAHETFMHEAKKSETVKSEQKSQAENDLSDAKTRYEQVSEDNRIAKEGYDEAMEYYAKLKPVCVVQPVSYEERVQGRNEEIDALREALEILGGDGHE